jgi:hypothetical protein
MLQQIALFISVIDVIRDMGLQTENGLDWAVGAEMARWYRKHTNVPPVKDNRPKTNGGGNHCFALYHESYRSKIESIVRAKQFEAARQPDLFAQEVREAKAGVEVDLVLPEWLK